MGNHLLLNVEKTARATESDDMKKLHSFVISGGGPTGVEISGMLAEIIHTIINKEYPISRLTII